MADNSKKKLNLGEVLTEVDGKPMLDGKKEFTLKSALLTTLSVTTEKDKEGSAMEKLQIGAMAIRVYEAKDTVSFSTEEMEILKKRIGEVWPSPIITFRLYKMLNLKP